MPTIKELAYASADAAFREDEDYGVPSSGAHEPDKANEIPALFDAIADAIDDLTEGLDELEDEVATGQRAPLAAVRVLTTSVVNPATGLENGDTVDGVVVATGDRVALAVPGGAANNGIWVVVASGAASRATDADSEAELRYVTFFVDEGSHAGEGWGVKTGTISIGVTAIVIDKVKAATGAEAEVVAARGDYASALVDRLTSTDNKIGKKSIFLDPHFEKVQNRGFIFGGKRVVSTLGTNGVWDPTYDWDEGKGAWKVETGGSTFALATWFAQAPEFQITTGSVISMGFEIKAAAGTDIKLRHYFFSTTDGTTVGSGVLTDLVATGERQFIAHENLTVPATAQGILCYIQEGASADDIWVIKHWVVMGETAGDAPPVRRLPRMEAESAALAAPASFVPNTPWLAADPAIFRRMVTTMTTGEPAGLRPISGDYAGFAMPFKWNDNIDGLIVYLGINTRGVPLRARFYKNDLTTLIATARIHAVAKRRGEFRFLFNESLLNSFLANGVVSLEVCYLAVDVPAGASIISGYRPMGFPNTMENVDFTTYPQLYTQTGVNFKEDLDDWLPVSGDSTLPFAWRAMAFDDSVEDEEVAPSPDQPVLGPYWTMFGPRETNAYLKNVRSGMDERRFSIGSGFNAIKLQDDRVVGIVGTTNFYNTFLTLNTLDDQGHIIKSITARADSSVPGLGSYAMKVLLIGDSHTAPARIGQRMLDMSSYYTSNLQVELLGRKEADSGVSVSAPFPFLASIQGVTNTGNRHEATGGFSFGGDGTDDSSYYSTNVANIFSHGGTKKFDFDFYLSDEGIDDPDVVVLWGCSNDVFAKQNGNIIVTDADAHEAMDTTIDHLDRMIGLTVDADVVSIQTTVPSAKIVIVMPAAVSNSQDGFALAYTGGGAGMSAKRYKRNNVIARWRLLEHYNTAAMKAAGIYLFDAGPAMDPVYGLPTTEDWSTSNTRSPVRAEPTASQNTLAVVHRPTDPIHPYKIWRQDFSAAFATVNGDATVTVHTDEPHGMKASSGPDFYRVRFHQSLPNDPVDDPDPDVYIDAPTVSGLNMHGTWNVTSVPTSTSFTFEHSGTANATTGAPTGAVTAFFLPPGGFEQMGERLWVFLETAVRSSWFTRSGAGP